MFFNLLQLMLNGEGGLQKVHCEGEREHVVGWGEKPPQAIEVGKPGIFQGNIF